MAEEYTLKIAAAIKKALGSGPPIRGDAIAAQPQVFVVERLTVYVQVKGDSWPR